MMPQGSEVLYIEEKGGKCCLGTSILIQILEVEIMDDLSSMQSLMEVWRSRVLSPSGVGKKLDGGKGTDKDSCEHREPCSYDDDQEEELLELVPAIAGAARVAKFAGKAGKTADKVSKVAGAVSD